MNQGSFLDERRFSYICDEFPCKIKYPLYYKAHKSEYVINPGEMIFIPAGWFHLVYSEGEGLNFAMNFNLKDVYKLIEGQSGPYTPRVEKCTIEPHKNISKYFKSETKLRVLNDSSGAIPSDILLYRYPQTEFNVKTISEFLRDELPHDYLMQNISDFPLPVPSVITTDYSAAVWANFCDVRTYIHYDLQNNWLCQLSGKKRIIIFPPEDRHLLYTLNPYPLKLIFSLTNDQFVIHNKSQLDQITVDLLNSQLGAKTKLIINNPKRIISRDISVLNGVKMFKIWALVNTSLIIRDKKYNLSPGDYIEWPNTFTHMYNFIFPLVFISEMEDH